MKLRTANYYLKEAIRNLVKNRLMSIASVLTVASCIFIVSVFYCLAANVDYFLSQLEGTLGIAVFVQDSLDPDEVLALSDRVSEIPHVMSVEYVSSEDALEEFKNILEDDNMLAGLELDNPLRRSFNIEIDDLNYQDDVLLALEQLADQGIGRIRHSGEVADIALTVSNVVQGVCLVLIGILTVISIVIIFNTIRITVNARRAEINIMKYVGATDWFIRWPFVVEGLLIGLIGGLIPAGMCWLGYERVVQAIKEELPVIGFVQFRAGYDIFAYLFPFAMALGILIGTLGSTLSIRQHLRV